MKHFVSVFITALLPLQAFALGPDETYPDVEHDDPLNETELRAAFTGKRHLGSYNFLNHGISSYAFEETTRADGSIKHVQEGRVDTGQWTITNNIICYDYDAPQLIKACFKMYLQGNCYYHYQVSGGGIPRFGFTARSVIAGETANCEPSYV